MDPDERAGIVEEELLLQELYLQKNAVPARNVVQKAGKKQKVCSLKSPPLPAVGEVIHRSQPPGYSE